MLPGFPKKVTVKKLARGRYELIRDDGYVVVAQRGVGRWWANSAWTAKSLGCIRFDMERGYTARDQLAKQHAETAEKYGF